MRKRIILGILVLLLFTGLTTTLAQVERQRYFPETGHIIRGAFLDAYESVPHPELIFGYPITEQYKNDTTDRQVQFFQRAHFELYPNNPVDLRVRFTPLGSILYQPQAETELSIPPNTPGCKIFADTRHQVCYAFLQFFEDNGGTAQFGYPISEIEIHEDRLVQYFHLARFEWHPERPAGDRVMLTDLGRLYFEQRKEDSRLLLPVEDDFIPQSILEIQVLAFSTNAAAPLEGSQTIHAVVQDQNLRPIENAQLLAIVRFPSGRESRYVMPLTNRRGISSISFAYDESKTGVVEILVTADYNGMKSITKTSFRLWW